AAHLQDASGGGDGDPLADGGDDATGDEDVLGHSVNLLRLAAPSPSAGQAGLGGRPGGTGRAGARRSRTTWAWTGNPELLTESRGLKFAGSAPSSRQKRSTLSSSGPSRRATGRRSLASSWLVSCTAWGTVSPVASPRGKRTTSGEPIACSWAAGGTHSRRPRWQTATPSRTAVY